MGKNLAFIHNKDFPCGKCDDASGSRRHNSQTFLPTEAVFAVFISFRRFFIAKPPINLAAKCDGRSDDGKLPTK